MSPTVVWRDARRGGALGRPRRRRVEDRHDPGRRFATRGAVVVVGSQATERHEELGGEDQDGQRRKERDPAGHQAQAELDGDQRDRHRRAPLEHEARLERRPQHAHRRVAIAQADLADPVDLLAAPAVRPQRGESAEHVGEVALHPAQVVGACRRGRSDPRADQAEDQDQDGSRDEQDERRERVDDRDEHEDEDRDDAGEQRRRPERAHPGLDGLGAVDERRRDLAAPFAGRVSGAELEEVRGHPLPDGPDQAHGRPPRERLARAGEQAAEQRRRPGAAAAGRRCRAPGHPSPGRRRPPCRRSPAPGGSRRPSTRSRRQRTRPRRSRAAVQPRHRGRAAATRDVRHRRVRTADRIGRRVPATASVPVRVDRGLASEEVVHAGGVRQHERHPDDRDDQAHDEGVVRATRRCRPSGCRRGRWSRR